MNAPNDFTALKSRQQLTWASGNYPVIGTWPSQCCLHSRKEQRA